MMGMATPFLPRTRSPRLCAYLQKPEALERAELSWLGPASAVLRLTKVCLFLLFAAGFYVSPRRLGSRPWRTPPPGFLPRLFDLGESALTASGKGSSLVNVKTS
jgi:hypothetical protein